MADDSAKREAALHAAFALDLRTIVVTSRLSLHSGSAPPEVARVLTKTAGLLSELERRVLSDGADPSLLAAIQNARESLRT